MTSMCIIDASVAREYHFHHFQTNRCSGFMLNLLYQRMTLGNIVFDYCLKLVLSKLFFNLD